jgi:hypothetical protein
MKTIHAITGICLLCFTFSVSPGFSQTKNAATDKQRQANLEKIQQKQAKMRKTYNNMSEEQKAEARARALERKTGKSVTGKPVNQTGTAQSKTGTVNNKDGATAKPINVPKKSKPTPVWKSSRDGSKTATVSKSQPKTGVNNNNSETVAKPAVSNPTSKAISAKPATKVSAESKPAPDSKPSVQNKSKTSGIKRINISKAKK